MANAVPDSANEEKIHLQNALVEAHHRVKNTLQNIISYINVMFSQRENITKADIKKLTRYLYALSSIHDILLEEVKISGNGTRVRLDRVVADLIQVRSVDEDIHCDDLPPLFSTARHAATLSLILSELIDNGIRHGAGTTGIKVEDQGDGFASIQITNSLKESNDISITKGNGLRICELLAKSELEASIDLSKENGFFTVILRFPIEDESKDRY